MPNLSIFIIFVKKTIINRNTLHINDLLSFFEHQATFTIKDIAAFYQQFESEVKRSTIDWRIHQLTELAIIHRIKRGAYSLKEQKKFKPIISDELYNLYQEIKEHFPFINLSVWYTKWLNQFMHHQMGKFFVLIEVDRGVEASVFYHLREKYNHLFLNPSIEILEKYGGDQKENIIIKSLISEAPLLKVNEIQIAPLEKILVDLLSDTLFEAYQGQELENIYASTLEQYNINQARMLRYAKRRSKKEEVLNQLNNYEKNT